jgi:hypothetical protein
MEGRIRGYPCRKNTICLPHLFPFLAWPWWAVPFLTPTANPFPGRGGFEKEEECERNLQSLRI